MKDLLRVGWRSYTLLHHTTMGTLHQEFGDVVMEDSRPELLRHMPIWRAAAGRVLVTGLGLGCVVRGLLATRTVESIDVVELDSDILRIVGAEFAGNDRVTLYQADALTWTWPAGRQWDFAWHDLWTEAGDKALQTQHMELLSRFFEAVGRQGAWALPRALRLPLSRRFPGRFL